MQERHPGAGGGEELPVRLVTLGTGDAQLEAEALGRLDEGVAHVVAVAHPDHGAPRDVAAVLHVGLDVGEHLTGMEAIGERVDDGNRGARRQLLEPTVLEGSHHDGVGHAGDDSRGVLHGLATPQVGVPGGEKDGVAAELGHAGLEGDARAGGRLLEHHGQHPSCKERLVIAGVEHGFDLRGPRENPLELRPREIGNFQEVSHRGGSHGSTLPRSSGRRARSG